jgi:hypothetical protein
MKKLLGVTIPVVALLTCSAPGFTASISKTSLGVPVTAAVAGNEGAIYDVPSSGMQLAGPGQSGAIFSVMYPAGMPTVNSPVPPLRPLQTQSFASSKLVAQATATSTMQSSPVASVAQQVNAEPVATQSLAALGGDQEPTSTLQGSAADPVTNPEPATLGLALVTISIAGVLHGLRRLAQKTR